jgi:hypothetical protein
MKSENPLILCLNTLLTLMYKASHSFTVILCPDITFLCVYPSVGLSVHSNSFALDKLMMLKTDYFIM